MIKILFEGDSITDAKRDRSNCRLMGPGYPKYATELILENNKGTEFDFMNLSIGGSRSDNLIARIEPEVSEIQPDIISILLGVNDVWHRHAFDHVQNSDEDFERDYSAVFEIIKKKTNAKILVMSPFLLETEDKEFWRPELERIIAIVEKIAKKYADVYVPLHEYFKAALEKQPEPCYYSKDGVHPNDNGAQFIGEIYGKAIQPLIDELK